MEGISQKFLVLLAFKHLGIATADLSMACNYCIRIMMGWYVLSKSHALRCI
jgi:hypothetical protein